MIDLSHFPWAVFGLSFFLMWISSLVGFKIRQRQPHIAEDVYHDLDLIVAGTLTLLSLIIGFSFSMAISRYDLRKNYEEAEANAIGTEYVRADFLPVADAATVRTLLKDYLDQRILFYTSRERLPEVNEKTAELQGKLWSAVHAPAFAQPTPILALVVSGMNDVLNSQGYTQAAWWNRIPPGAWCLMAAVSIGANFLVGYDTRNPSKRHIRLVVLPAVLCVAFFAIADIDSPRRGVIRVQPQNLINLAQSLQGH
jgi:hypothetical protein